MASDRIELRPNTLRAWIMKCLDDGEFIPDMANVLLRKDKMEVNQKDETEYWDYKQEVDLNNPLKIAQLAKWILAFHNASGGVIIFGVNNNYKVTGVYEGEIVDTVKLRDKLKKYIGTGINLFQGRIQTHDYIARKTLLWLVFIPRRANIPVPAGQNGPNGSDGRPVIQEGRYYIRINDESKLCASPNDLERVFAGASFKHLSAYTYDVDEPFFRLLAPHQAQFIGRRKILDDIRLALDSRSYIISLDGVGGVGKSALAIELARQLYRAKSYDFIVSLSAKNRIWVKNTEARRANFSGYTELVTEIAKVLDIVTVDRPIEEIKTDLIKLMTGTNGLLLIDNIEEIDDTAVFSFLKDDVPEPVKIIVTSRISRDLPSRVIPITGMTQEEALTLLYQELERTGYNVDLNEVEDANEITKAAGYLPLAIKWAASLASLAGSLHEVSSRLRKRDSTKKEFLDFCFATMYDGLSEPAKNAALLCPYLLDDWNTLTLSVALKEPVSRMERAIAELEDRGIIQNISGTFSMLPLTTDFLSNKWHENRAFRDEVTARIAAAFTSQTYGGNLFNWPADERVRVLKETAKAFEEERMYEEALRTLRLAHKWESDEVKKQVLRLIEGRIVFLSGDRREGLEVMSAALHNIPIEEGLHDDVMFFAEALLSHGKNKEEGFAMEKIVKHIAFASNVTRKLIGECCAIALRDHNYALLALLMEQTKQATYAFWIAREVWPFLEDRQVIFHLGEPLLKVLRLGMNAPDASEVEKGQLAKRAEEVRQMFEHSGGKASR